mgnify:CR=1 FL=1
MHKQQTMTSHSDLISTPHEQASKSQMHNMKIMTSSTILITYFKSYIIKYSSKDLAVGISNLECMTNFQPGTHENVLNL